MCAEDDQTNEPKCSCGVVEDLEFGPDPFMAEIHADYTPLWICEACRDQRKMDI